MSLPSIAARGRRANRSPWVERLGRAGLVAKGVLYLVVAILAAKVAFGADERADREGALRAIAAQPFGRGLLTLLALGLFGYAAWRIAQGVYDRDSKGDDAPGLTKRAGAVARGLWYAGLGVLTVSKIVGADSGGGGGASEDRTTAGVLGLPFGRYLVFAAGAAFLAAAGWNAYRGITCNFRKRLRTGRMSDAEEAATTGAGVLGHLARAAVFTLVGLFLGKAAWEYDPQEAHGLDATLREVAAQPSGTFLLLAVAAGLAAYGLYCFAQARYRDV
ncbi:MAG TPA: DUF1206 domain-containing protein [Gaiellaceae bacterium]|nr:DUF1206 domain-containing protein [Gaiellaceae bacterium]